MMQNRSTIAKKKFGQNFLIDETIVQQIIQSIPKSDRPVVEIGPGLGDLTRYLVDIRSVDAFEVDTDLCSYLEHHFAHALSIGHLNLHCGDVLTHWERGSLLDREYDLVANLPYYIATALILRALADTACHTMLVMVQREVAEKFCAQPNERPFGALSVIAQSIAEVEIVVNVPPSAFEPAPKVDSAVMLIHKHANRHDAAFEEFLRVAFAQPRKTLYKNLSTRYQASAIEAALADLGHSRTIRPHQLSVSDFHQLYTAFTH